MPEDNKYSLQCSHLNHEKLRFNGKLFLCNDCRRYVTIDGSVLLYRNKGFFKPSKTSVHVSPEPGVKQFLLSKMPDQRLGTLSPGINEIIGISRVFKYTPNTTFLAIHLFKEYMEKEGFADNTVDPLAMSRISLFIASKMRERDTHFRLLNEYINVNGIYPLISRC